MTFWFWCPTQQLSHTSPANSFLVFKFLAVFKQEILTCRHVYIPASATVLKDKNLRKMHFSSQSLVSTLEIRKVTNGFYISKSIKLSQKLIKLLEDSQLLSEIEEICLALYIRRFTLSCEILIGVVMQLSGMNHWLLEHSGRKLKGRDCHLRTIANLITVSLY